jgi:hypothetical protein
VYHANHSCCVVVVVLCGWLFFNFQTVQPDEGDADEIALMEFWWRV